MLCSEAASHNGEEVPAAACVTETPVRTHREIVAEQANDEWNGVWVNTFREAHATDACMPPPAHSGREGLSQHAGSFSVPLLELWKSTLPQTSLYSRPSGFLCATTTHV